MQDNEFQNQDVHLSKEQGERVQILNGKEVAKSILQNIRRKLDSVEGKPGLAVIQVGEDPASSIYVSRKEARAKKLGFHSIRIRLPKTSSDQEILEHIERLNQDAKIHGILVQLPLPKNCNEQKILETILPEKDIDGFHCINAGLLTQNRKDRKGIVPCTPKGVMHILEHYDISLEGKHAVVIGRSNIVGRPMAALLEHANCTVTLCHSRTKDLPKHLGMADIVVAAVGIPKLVKGEWLKEGVVVIDVGINRLGDGSICGDVDFESAKEIASAITPVPGGVGPTTIASLMENTFFVFQNT